MLNTKPEAVSTDTFASKVLAADTPVLVDFWAEWCGPCRMVAPVLDQLAEEFEERVAIKKVDVDENQALAEQFGIRSIPTLIVFKNGEPVETITGVQSRSTLTQALERHV